MATGTASSKPSDPKPSDTDPKGPDTKGADPKQADADQPAAPGTIPAGGPDQRGIATAIPDTRPDSAADPRSDDVFNRALARAPHLTREFVAEHELTDDDLEAIATGLEPAPPYNGPIKTTELHRTPGGWQVTPLGVQPEDLPVKGR